jgi:hypothetical protein
MPKVKDLGVTVVPEQFGPLEIGPGGGGCYQTQWCSDCTNVPFSICGTTPGAGGGARGGGCTDCTQQAFSICGTTPGGGGGAAARPGGGCTDCTQQAFSICGTSPGPVCTDCTYRPFSLCGGTFVACQLQTHNPWTPCGGTWETPCGGSWGDPWRRGGGLTQQGIDQIRQQLNAQLKALEEAEKSLGPQSVEEIEAREKEINAELDRLKAARATLKKK